MKKLKFLKKVAAFICIVVLAASMLICNEKGITVKAETSSDQKNISFEHNDKGAKNPSINNTYKGHSYSVLNMADLKTVNSWTDAVKYCESIGGHMATISSQKENDFIYNYIKESGYKNVYFGFTDCEKEGSWKWVNGEKVSYTNWHQGEPNNQWGTEHYAMFYESNTDGTWNDGDFTTGNIYFLCEWDNGGAVTVGAKITVGKMKYKVIKINKDGAGEVMLIGTSRKKSDARFTHLVIGNAVKIKGKFFKIIAIGEYAFCDYKKLESVTIGKNINSIKTKAFYNCKHLKKIIIKTKKLQEKTVGNKAFKGIYPKADIKAPKGKVKSYKKILRVKDIGKYAKIHV